MSGNIFFKIHNLDWQWQPRVHQVGQHSNDVLIDHWVNVKLANVGLKWVCYVSILLCLLQDRYPKVLWILKFLDGGAFLVKAPDDSMWAPTQWSTISNTAADIDLQITMLWHPEGEAGTKISTGTSKGPLRAWVSIKWRFCIIHQLAFELNLTDQPSLTFKFIYMNSGVIL